MFSNISRIREFVGKFVFIIELGVAKYSNCRRSPLTTILWSQPQVYKVQTLARKPRRLEDNARFECLSLSNAIVILGQNQKTVLNNEDSSLKRLLK